MDERLALWVKLSVDDIFNYFSYFFPENKYWHFEPIVSVETICMKGQILFSGKNKKVVTILSSAELVQRVV